MTKLNNSWKFLDGGSDCKKGHKMLFYAVFINPFLNVWTPSTLLIHWALLSLAIFWSSIMAQVLFLASCEFPGPTWWSLPRRQLTWACTAAWDSLLLIWPTRTPSSSSLPGRSASAWTRWWTPSLPVLSGQEALCGHGLGTLWVK